MSVHRRTDGWRVRWRENGLQRSREFTRKSDADAWDRDIKRRRQLGPLAVEQLTERGSTLGEWITERWSPEHGATLEHSTRTRYAEVYGLHIAPWLDDVPIRELSVSRLRAWQAERVAAGVSAGTMKKTRTFLSSVLRHAAESEAIPGNPLALVRAPRAEHTDAVVPLAPATVETIRSALVATTRVHVPAGTRGGRPRRAYEREGRRETGDRMRDAAIVSVLAYAGLRPGEVRALRWDDVRDKTLLVQRSAGADGAAKSTKTRAHRPVRLLAPLAADLRAWRLASGRPDGPTPVFPRHDGTAWTKEDWGNWRERQWAEACSTAGLVTVPRPYDLRHSFASLLLAEGRTIHYVAAQLGHSPALTLSTYGHVLAEFAETDRIDAEAEIAKARREACSLRVPTASI